jgi:phosphate uptake regulator
METRKVQLSGGTTYTISLPKSWAREHGIDAQSLVALHPKGDGSLVVDVTGDHGTDERSVTVDTSTVSEAALEERLSALYQVGFDEVLLRDRTGHPTDLRLAVKDAISELSGFELLETSETRIRLMNLIDAENVDIRKSALRLKLVMLSMHRDAITAIVEDDADLAQRVADRDSEADKLFAMITRHFRRSLSDLQEVDKLDHSRDTLFEYYYACRQFERVSDHAEKMAAFVTRSDRPVPDDLVSHLDTVGDRARSMLDAAADVLLADADIETAYDVLESRDDLLSEIETLDRELYDHGESDAAYTAGVLLDSIRRTAQHGANVAEIAIQQTSRTTLPGGDGARVTGGSSSNAR